MGKSVASTISVKMIQHPIPGHAAVAVTMRPRESGAGGGQRLETDTLQIAGAAHIPRIRNDEAAALVQAMKCAAFIGDAGTNMRHAETPAYLMERRVGVDQTTQRYFQRIKPRLEVAPLVDGV